MKMPLDARHMIDQSGLGHLVYTMFRHLDIPLISAFVERWQPDTNTFHMPFGEVTILVHDVWQILRVPVEGALVTADPDAHQLQCVCMELLGVDREQLTTHHWRSGGVLTDSILSLCGAQRSSETQAIAWMWMLLGSTLFVDKSGNRVRPSILNELKDGVEGIETYSWGAATLAYLYRQLGIASRGDCQGIAGCLTLLQAWIYEYFPCFRPHRDRLAIDEGAPRACSWSVRAEDKSDRRLCALRARLDQLTADEVHL